MRTTRFIKIEGLFELWGVYLDNVLIKIQKRRITDWK